jgi:two-component system cell cycle sensor histidine kinase/response regulator CckA
VLRERIEACARDGRVSSTPFRLRHVETGRLTWVWERRWTRLDATGNVRHWEGVWLDHTRQTLAESGMPVAAWKEPLSLITTGLIHDLNNCLTGILPMSENGLQRLLPGQPGYEELRLIRESAQRAAELLRRLSRVHHEKAGEVAYLDLNALAQEAIDLLRVAMRRRIKLASQFHAAPLPVRGDAFELRRAMLCLAFKAAEFISARGQITFTTRPVAPLSQAEAPEGAEDSEACVSICLQGADRAPADWDRLFDPWFVTEGCKLPPDWGPAVARGLILKHQGTVTSCPGTTAEPGFELRLPLARLT